MVSGVLALAGFFISLYLWFWKVGLLGALACGDGACETVQLSSYATFLGVPVAFVGVIGYLSILGTSIWGLHGQWAARREPTLVLVALSGVAVAFTGYLTYLEAAVIEAWCRWCLVSAAIIVAIFAAAVAGLVSGRGRERTG